MKREALVPLFFCLQIYEVVCDEHSFGLSQIRSSLAPSSESVGMTIWGGAAIIGGGMEGKRKTTISSQGDDDILAGR